MVLRRVALHLRDSVSVGFSGLRGGTNCYRVKVETEEDLPFEVAIQGIGHHGREDLSLLVMAPDFRAGCVRNGAMREELWGTAVEVGGCPECLSVEMEED